MYLGHVRDQCWEDYSVARESVYVCVLASTNAARLIKINFSQTFFDTWQLSKVAAMKKSEW